MLRHAHWRCVLSPQTGEKRRPCTRRRTLAPRFPRFFCPDRQDSTLSRPSRPTITSYSESKSPFKTHDGPRPPQTPPASSKRPNQKWPGITAEPFSHYFCRATSDWVLTFLRTYRETITREHFIWHRWRIFRKPAVDASRFIVITRIPAIS